MGQLAKLGNNLFKVGGNVFRYNSQYTFGSALSPITSAQGVPSTLEGVAIDYPSASFPNGRIFLTNYGNNNVLVFNYINPYAGSPTIITQAQGSFSTPIAIAIDAANNRIYVTNYSGSTVSILNYLNPSAGSATVITQTQGSFNVPRGIAIDAANNRIFVTNVNSSTVSIVNYSNVSATGAFLFTSTTVITTTQGTFNSPRGIAIDNTNNRIFIVNNGNYTVSILNYLNPTAGSPTVITTTQGTFNSPVGIAIDTTNNRIFVLNGNTTVSNITNNFT